MIWEPVSAAAMLLSAWVTAPQPWLAIQADSEQRQPVYLGATPRELALGLGGGESAALPQALRDLAERKLHTLARKIGTSHFEVELWPAQNDRGQRTWAFARWRENSARTWQWITPAQAPSSDERGADPETFFPAVYRSWIKKESAQVFDDFLLLDDLYAKPFFGDCIWSAESGMEIYGAWVPLDSLATVQESALAARAVCRVLPQPARFQGKPYELVAAYDSGAVSWPENVSWNGSAPPQPRATKLSGTTATWPGDFESRYRDDVLTLAGEQEAVFPSDGKTERFVRKSSADPSNQLLDLASYLEERYAALGVQTRRQSFVWRDIPQANLIAAHN